MGGARNGSDREMFGRRPVSRLMRLQSRPSSMLLLLEIRFLFPIPCAQLKVSLGPLVSFTRAHFLQCAITDR